MSSDPSFYAELWARVMNDLRLATHCHSCGGSMNVALLGYCGTHCSKLCWKMNELEADEEFVCPFGGCTICDGGTVSLARSTRHRDVLTGWPMRCGARPCTNTTIASKRPVYVAHHMILDH